MQSDKMAVYLAGEFVGASTDDNGRMMRIRCALLFAFLCAPLSVQVTYAQEFDCLIEAKQTVEILSPVEAVIKSIRVSRGDYVKKGDVLVTLESGAEEASLRLAQSRVVLM